MAQKNDTKGSKGGQVPARQEYRRTGKAPTPANTGAGGKSTTPKTT